jgi:hypothetical protein
VNRRWFCKKDKAGVTFFLCAQAVCLGGGPALRFGAALAGLLLKKTDRNPVLTNIGYTFYAYIILITGSTFCKRLQSRV